MGKIVTFVSVPWVRSGISIKSTCVRYSGDAQHATKTVILRQMYHECHWIFLSFFCSRAISPACSVDLGKSPTWWKSTWRSRTRTSTLKVGRRWRKFKLQLFTLLMMNDLFCVCLSVALQVVFGSLYRDDVLIKPSRVVSILAAACMLQLVSVTKTPSCL